MCCPVTYQCGLSEGTAPCRISLTSAGDSTGYLPMRPGETCSLTVTLPNEQHILIPEAVVLWSREEEFGIEMMDVLRHTRARLGYYVQRLIGELVLY